MPELPEVETVVRGLRRRLTGVRLGRVLYASMRVARENPAGWRDALCGRTMKQFERRGKYIIIHLTGKQSLVVHLRMTGRIWIKPDPHPRGKHDRLIIALSRRRCLVLVDARQFARAHWCPPGTLDAHPGLRKLGPDALTITDEQFAALCRNTRRPIKSLLLDQTRLAGVGNIYADESLYAARIHPLAASGTISHRKLTCLRKSLHAIFVDSIKACGTSIDTFSDLEGTRGGFGPQLKIYRRTGSPCHICRTPIRRISLSGRGTHFCPRCQRR